jgi:hypothetical protein
LLLVPITVAVAVPDPELDFELELPPHAAIPTNTPKRISASIEFR